MRGTSSLAHCRVGTHLTEMECNMSKEPDAWRSTLWLTAELAHTCKTWKAFSNHNAPRSVPAAALASIQDDHPSAVYATTASAATTADHRPRGKQPQRPSSKGSGTAATSRGAALRLRFHRTGPAALWEGGPAADAANTTTSAARARGTKKPSKTPQPAEPSAPQPPTQGATQLTDQRSRKHSQPQKHREHNTDATASTAAAKHHHKQPNPAQRSNKRNKKHKHNQTTQTQQRSQRKRSQQRTAGTRR